MTTRATQSFQELICYKADRMDEEMEACIHCDYLEFSEDLQDGLCQTCKNSGLPNRTELAHQKRIKRRVIASVSLMLLLTLAGLLIYHL